MLPQARALDVVLHVKGQVAAESGESCEVLEEVELSLGVFVIFELLHGLCVLLVDVPQVNVVENSFHGRVHLFDVLSDHPFDHEVPVVLHLPGESPNPLHHGVLLQGFWNGHLGKPQVPAACFRDVDVFFVRLAGGLVPLEFGEQGTNKHLLHQVLLALVVVRPGAYDGKH